MASNYFGLAHLSLANVESAMFAARVACACYGEVPTKPMSRAAALEVYRATQQHGQAWTEANSAQLELIQRRSEADPKWQHWWWSLKDLSKAVATAIHVSAILLSAVVKQRDANDTPEKAALERLYAATARFCAAVDEVALASEHIYADDSPS